MTTTAQNAPRTTDELPADDAELRQLCDDFTAAGITPLWTQRADLQPPYPQPSAVPAKWAWSTLFPLAERAGQLVPVGRGGERRLLADSPVAQA